MPRHSSPFRVTSFKPGVGFLSSSVANAKDEDINININNDVRVVVNMISPNHQE
jgi:hypothetical protein